VGGAPARVLDPDHNVRAQAGGRSTASELWRSWSASPTLVQPVIQDAVASAVKGPPALSEVMPATPGGESQDDAEQRWTRTRGRVDPTML